MKLILSFVLILHSMCSIGQITICVAADCKTTIKLPQDTLSLNGLVNSINKVSKIQWGLISGDKNVFISNNTTLSTPISKLISGTYIFSFTATTIKNEIAQTLDTVIVLPANKKPKATITSLAKSVTLPVNTITLDGSSSIDSDGVITSYRWSTGDTSKKINLMFGGVGVYNYSLIVTDNEGSSDTTTTSITVNPQIILPPVCSITGPSIINGTIDTLIAIATDQNPNGSIKQYGWGKISGPGTQTIIGANTSKIIITGLQAGAYSFKCTIWNAAGLTVSSTINFIVNPITKTITKVITTYYYSDGTSITTQYP